MGTALLAYQPEIQVSGTYFSYKLNLTFLLRNPIASKTGSQERRF